MGKKWTVEQREAQSIRIKEAWARRKAAQQKPKTPAWVQEETQLDRRAAEDLARAKLLPEQLPWWRRVMLALGFGHRA